MKSHVGQDDDIFRDAEEGVNEGFAVSVVSVIKVSSKETRQNGHFEEFSLIIHRFPLIQIVGHEFRQISQIDADGHKSDGGHDKGHECLGVNAEVFG